MIHWDPLWPLLGGVPLELKIFVLFGRCVGGNLHSHPWHLWVFGDGGDLHLWKWRFPGKPRSWAHCYGPTLPEAALERLQAVLRRDFARLKRHSEALALTAKVDELRVDWLLGDPRFGSRLGELTFIGSADRLVPPIQEAMARAFFRGHRSRKEEIVVGSLDAGVAS